MLKTSLADIRKLGFNFIIGIKHIVDSRNSLQTGNKPWCLLGQQLQKIMITKNNAVDHLFFRAMLENINNLPQFLLVGEQIRSVKPAVQQSVFTGMRQICQKRNNVCLCVLTGRLDAIIKPGFGRQRKLDTVNLRAAGVQKPDITRFR